MISPENLVFDRVSDALRAEFEGIYVAGEYIDVPARFPAVTIMEEDNSVAARMRTEKIENAVELMYETNVYSNLIGYKKAQAKRIQQILDREFEAMGFERIMSNPMPNLQDASIYRIFSRYHGYDMPEYSGDDVNHRIYTG